LPGLVKRPAVFEETVELNDLLVVPLLQVPAEVAFLPAGVSGREKGGDYKTLRFRGLMAVGLKNRGDALESLQVQESLRVQEVNPGVARVDLHDPARRRFRALPQAAADEVLEEFDSRTLSPRLFRPFGGEGEEGPGLFLHAKTVEDLRGQVRGVGAKAEDLFGIHGSEIHGFEDPVVPRPKGGDEINGVESPYRDPLLLPVSREERDGEEKGDEQNGEAIPEG
jgi:hypothetical protein